MKNYHPGAGEQRMLLTLRRYHYLTAEQVTRLLYSRGSHTFVQTRLKNLADSGMLATTTLRRSHRGRATTVYTLSRKAHTYLDGLGIAPPVRFRPGEVTGVSEPHLDHALAINDVLIAADLFVAATPGVELAQVVHERELKHQAVPVVIAGERISVVPDGWLDFRMLAQGYRTCIALELDRGTEEQKRWKRKVRGLVAWASGPYRERFGTDVLTVAVITTEDERRAAQLRAWTEEELTRLDHRSLAELFLFTCCDPATTDPVTLFTAPIFTVTFAEELVPLL